MRRFPGMANKSWSWKGLKGWSDGGFMGLSGFTVLKDTGSREMLFCRTVMWRSFDRNVIFFKNDMGPAQILEVLLLAVIKL